MKEDIPFLPVENVMISVVQKPAEVGDPEWFVYLLNRNDLPINTVMITSKGYGKKDGEEQNTSTLRHVIPEVDAGEYALVEPIQPEVFHLNNEYWVSYYIDGQIYDKKFIFVQDTIKEENLIEIKELGLQGVLHS
ncbi:MAG: hypothetical protein NXI20_08075 [bacterium]|nr:hypothetical protein [bacterium]